MVLFLLAPLGTCAGSILTACACSACTCVTREAMNRSARLAYSLLFLLSMLLAWGLRDFAKPILTRIPWIMHSFSSLDLPPDAWFGAQAVYRVSLGNFVMFGGLALLTVGVRTRGDWRDARLHHGPAWVKVLVWATCNVLPLLAPNALVIGYSWLARAASPLFLLLQMVILVDAAHQWNDSWVTAGDDDERWLYGLLGATLGCYAGVVAILSLAAAWFLPSGVSCDTNLAIVVLAATLVLAVSVASMHPSVPSGSLFPASVVSLYVAYLSYSALLSEPRDEACNLLGKRLSAASGTSLALGMLATLLSVVWSAFRAGSNSTTFSWGDDAQVYDESTGRLALAEYGPGAGIAPAHVTEGGLGGYASLGDGPIAGAKALPTPADDGALAPAVSPTLTDAPGTELLGRSEPVSVSGPGAAAPTTAAAPLPAVPMGGEGRPIGYSYAQFYTVFALASAYMSMLMTGWGSGITQRDVIDVGWTSVFVKASTAAVAAALYVWTLVAPALFPDREFV